jgi:serine/threonine-protein kinase
MKAHHEQVAALFLKALRLPADQRAAYLDQAKCDTCVRQEVQHLLAQDADPVTALATQSAVRDAIIRAIAETEIATETVGSPSATDFVEGSHHGQFLPGTMLTKRYRIVSLLGKGGMGEVYRADDLELGQSVALKFLPRDMADDHDRLTRFRNEVRVARQVSHPNVCRIYDLGEVDGQYFLSMEYVDGEDLSVVLRRLGRLANEKAVEISRQLCSGLAAAHAIDVLHRDLKPANVMIDGRGRVRLTDFGLATLAGRLPKKEIVAGTPAYMAPEQLAGREVSTRSDIYSLGLVLFEVFTGQCAFNQKSLANIQDRHNSDTRTRLSDIVDMDPAVERVILRCLAVDPQQRPPSALAVAAALPGGDPLAAALEAGETPSPEMVANAGDHGGLHPRTALSCLLFVIAGLSVITWLNSKYSLLHVVRPEKPPQVLADRAQTIVGRLGLGGSSVDHAFGFVVDRELLRNLAQADHSSQQWNEMSGVRNRAISFWYRQGPNDFVPSGPAGRVTEFNPPVVTAGMINLRLNPSGNLVELWSIPTRQKGPRESPQPPPWPDLFTEAGLDYAAFTASAQQTPPVFSDSLIAWEGPYSDNRQTMIRVEAAAFRGVPVYFGFMELDAEPGDMVPSNANHGRTIMVLVLLVLLAIALLTAVVLARRHLQLGRGDKRGSARLALFAAATYLAAWLLSADHIASIFEVNLLLSAMGRASLMGLFFWIMHVALEPLIRRRWPESLTAWNRLLSGRFRDPMIGRAILFGAVAQTTTDLMLRIVHISSQWLGQPALVPAESSMDALLGGGYVLAECIRVLPIAASYPLVALLVIIFFRALFRRQGLAMVAFVLLLTVLPALGASRSALPFALAANAIMATCIIILLTQCGVLTLVAAAMFGLLHSSFPLSYEFSAWYARGPQVAIAASLVLVLFGFYTSLAGQPLFKDGLSES